MLRELQLDQLVLLDFRTAGVFTVGGVAFAVMTVVLVIAQT